MAEIGKDIEKAKWILEQGDLVAIPTETVYGLAGNALNLSSVTKIFDKKIDPILIHSLFMYLISMVLKCMLKGYQNHQEN